MQQAKVETLSANAEMADIINILGRDGCVVLENVLNETALTKLQADLRESFDKTENCHGDFYGYSTKRLGALFTKSEICQQMAIEPSVLSVMDKFLLKGCEQYQINLTQGISIGSGEQTQIMHQDDPMFPFMHPDHEAMINCMWAVDDFTAENGATYLVPGSHKWPREQVIDPDQMRLPQPHEITQGVMKAGSVLIYFGSLYHSGGNNMTQKPRRGAVISYCLGWLRQAENSYLAYSREEARAMPERLQRLLGYFVHSPNLGSVEGRDPIELLQGNNLSHAQFEEFIPENAQEILRQYKESQKTAA